MGAVDSLRGTRRGRVDTARAFDYVRDTMFTQRNGDRPRARNYIVMMTGNERSMNTQRAFAAASRLKVLCWGWGGGEGVLLWLFLFSVASVYVRGVCVCACACLSCVHMDVNVIALNVCAV